MIAALSLIPDIPWIWDAIMGNSSSGGFSLAQARAARASRVGTKAGRIVRFVRLIRVVRVGKLVEMCGKRSKKNKAKAKEYAESNLSKSLSEQTTRKVTMMVLAMLLVVPMLAYVETDETETNAINQIVLLADDSTVTPTAFNEAVAWLTKFYKETRPVLSLQIYGTTHEYDFVADDITTFRFVSFSYFTLFFVLFVRVCDDFLVVVFVATQRSGLESQRATLEIRVFWWCQTRLTR